VATSFSNFTSINQNQLTKIPLATIDIKLKF